MALTGMSASRPPTDVKVAVWREVCASALGLLEEAYETKSRCAVAHDLAELDLGMVE